MRFDVVYSSASPRRAHDIYSALHARGFNARERLAERPNRGGRRTRTHEVLVPHGDVARATSAVQTLTGHDDPVPAKRFILRDRMGQRAYEGLMTVAGMAIALAIIGIYLVHAS